ncbi:MAG: hypothetical protein MR574_01815, partial [Oscillospiraceae bacterium]|nr:hypothetical protein [Oscillospiraceae bacterium]
MMQNLLKFVTVIYSYAPQRGRRNPSNGAQQKLCSFAQNMCVFAHSAQVGGGDVVHIVKFHILAAHSPDEG